MTRRHPLLALAAAVTFAAPATGVATAGTVDRAPGPRAGSATLSIADRLDARRYVAAGTRAYDVGTEAGRYPAMGFHTRGEMGGIWTPPLKLLDGLWFGVDGTWVGPATRFTSGYGYVRMDLPAPAGLRLTRTDVVPDGRRAVLVGLTLTAKTARTVRLALDAHSELMSAYPWGETKPSQLQYNLPDTASVAGGRLVFREVGRPPVAGATAHDWAALVGSSLTPVSSVTGRAFRGPQDPPVVCPPSPDPDRYRCDDTAYGKGAGGSLRYAVPLKAGQARTVWFTVAGSDRGLADARREYATASRSPGAQLQAKIARRTALASRTRVDLPGDRRLQTAVEWGKQNLADLEQEARGLAVRRTSAGTTYPAPAGHVDRIHFEGAGFPDYPWLFATDGEYTAFPLVAAGRADLVADHLRALKAVSLIANGASGKVVHEVVSTGDIYYGLNSDDGDIDETAKFPSSVALVWRWTGSNAFRDEMYGFAKRNVRYLLTRVDADGDGWPEGAGNVEATGLGAEKLDVAVYTIRALYDLADMAASKGDTATASWARSHGAGLRAKFERTWWMPKVPAYADSLTDPGNAKTQQRWWIGVTPMEAEIRTGATASGLASAAHARQALALRQRPCYTGPSGLYVQGAPGCDPAAGGNPDNRMTFSLNTAVMAVGLGNYGELAAQRRYNDANAELMLRPDEQPGALPEIGPSPSYGRSIDKPFNERAMIEQAWGQYGIIWPVVHQQLGVSPDLGNGRLEVVPQLPPGQSRIAGSHIQVGAGSVTVTASRSGSAYRTEVVAGVSTALFVGVTLPAGTAVRTVTLNGTAHNYIVRDTNRGREVLVRAGTGSTQVVVVRTR